MEGQGGEDLVAAAMAAISLAAENVSQTDLLARIARLQAQNDTLVANNNELVMEKDKLVADIAMLREDKDSMEDRIAELEAQANDNSVNLDDSTVSSCGNETVPPDGTPPSPDGAFVDPLDKIPKWRIRYICDRIATGQRPTICNMMYINIYAHVNRFHGAEDFKQRIVKAFKTMCLRYREELDVPTIQPDDIPTDFDTIKNHLKDLATINEQEYIVKMFRVFQNN